MAELDLGAVRAFVVVAGCRHFGEAAAELGITQQAVSKRIARLESDLGTTLLTRLRSGTGLSHDGQLFLPHARALLDAADRAVAALHNDRPLCVDVQDTRLAGAELVRRFYETVAGLDIDVVASGGLRVARAKLEAGTVDAAFARVGPVDDGVARVPAWLEPTVVLVSAEHPLAQRGQNQVAGFAAAPQGNVTQASHRYVTKQNRPSQRDQHIEFRGGGTVAMAELAGATAWMPGNERGSEWADFWDAASAEFGVRIDTTGPNFGWEHHVAELRTRTDRIGFVGQQCRLPPHPGVVRLAVTPPYPAYPWSLLWQRRNRHAALPRLVAHVRAGFRPYDPAEIWLPEVDRAAFRDPDALD